MDASRHQESNVVFVVWKTPLFPCIEWWNDRYRRGRGDAIYDHYRCNRCAPLSPTVQRDYLFKQQVVLKTAINRRRLQFMCPLNAPSYFFCARKRERGKLIIRSPIIHYFLDRKMSDRSFENLESWITIQDYKKTRNAFMKESDERISESRDQFFYFKFLNFKF